MKYAKLATARMCSASAFHAVRLACEKARWFASLVPTAAVSMQIVDDVDRRPERGRLALATPQCLLHMSGPCHETLSAHYSKV